MASPFFGAPNVFQGIQARDAGRRANIGMFADINARNRAANLQERSYEEDIRRFDVESGFREAETERNQRNLDRSFGYGQERDLIGDAYRTRVADRGEYEFGANLANRKSEFSQNYDLQREAAGRASRAQDFSQGLATDQFGYRQSQDALNRSDRLNSQEQAIAQAQQAQARAQQQYQGRQMEADDRMFSQFNNQSARQQAAAGNQVSQETPMERFLRSTGSQITATIDPWKSIGVQKTDRSGKLILGRDGLASGLGNYDPNARPDTFAQSATHKAATDYANQVRGYNDASRSDKMAMELMDLGVDPGTGTVYDWQVDDARRAAAAKTRSAYDAAQAAKPRYTNQASSGFSSPMTATPWQLNANLAPSPY